MAMTVTVAISDQQQAALEWVAGGPENAEAYLQARNTEILDSYVRGHSIDKAPVPPIDMATAYVYATPEQQQAALAALGMPTTPLLVLSDVWTWSTQTLVPPNTNQVRTDSGDWAGATLFNLDVTANGGKDYTAELTTLQVSDTIRIQHSSDSTRTASFTVAQPAVDNQGYSQVQVTLVSADGTLPNSSTNVSIRIERPILTTPSQMSSDLQAAGVPS